MTSSSNCEGHCQKDTTLDNKRHIGHQRDPHPKIQQTKMLATCQRFGDLFLFGLIWQYSSNHKTYKKGRFKVIASYLLAAVINFEPTCIIFF